jgi:hypothetical protein
MDERMCVPRQRVRASLTRGQQGKQGCASQQARLELCVCDDKEERRQLRLVKGHAARGEHIQDAPGGPHVRAAAVVAVAARKERM